MIIVSFFYFGNKNFEEIQQIVRSTIVANLAKQAVKTTIDLAIILKKKQLEKYLTKPKQTKSPSIAKKKQLC